jgi:hypothetical protein
VFHVTQLKKEMPVLENEVITEANAWIEPDFSPIEHPLRVLDQKSESPEDKQYECTRYNGVTTRKKRQCGRRRNTSTPSIQDSCSFETVSFPSHLIVLKLNFGTRFHLRGVGCDALGFYLTLIVSQLG